MSGEAKSWYVAALYHFASVEAPAAWRSELLALGPKLSLLGTLIVAEEGINGTVAGTPEAIGQLLATLRKRPGFEGLEAKFSWAPEPPFGRFMVKHKPEICTLRAAGADPREGVGEYVEAEDWNALISRDDVRVIDTRNAFEFAAGTFEGAEDPQTESFTDFAAYVRSELAADKQRPLALFCTGGIRCEKATALLKHEGFEQVYHLKGGILRYLERIPEGESKWQGECFVFDTRRTVDHQLAPGTALRESTP